MAGQGNPGELLRELKIRRAAAFSRSASSSGECRIPAGKNTLKVRAESISVGTTQRQEGRLHREM